MHDNAFAYSTLNESIECMRRTKKDTQFAQFIYNANHSLRAGYPLNVYARCQKQFNHFPLFTHRKVHNSIWATSPIVKNVRSHTFMPTICIRTPEEMPML